MSLTKLHIQTRIKVGCLEVWDTGVVSPAIMVKVMLTAHIIKSP